MNEIIKNETLTGRPMRPCHHPGCAALTRERYCDRHAPLHIKLDIRPDDQQAWRRLYKTTRWKQLRATQLLMQPFCADCAKRGERVRASDVDHIKDHKGNKALFYDAGNLQSLCHSCHSRKTLTELQRSSGANQPPRGKKV